MKPSSPKRASNEALDALYEDGVAEIAILSSRLSVEQRKEVIDFLLTKLNPPTKMDADRIRAELRGPRPDFEPIDEAIAKARRGQKKSFVRIKVEELAKAEIGASVLFPYGSFTSKQSIASMINNVGGPGWTDVRQDGSGTTITKTAEPRK